MTGDRPGDEHQYYGLWRTKATSRDELRSMEMKTHSHFRESRLRRSNGADTEWFNIPFDTIANFLTNADFTACRIPNELIADIKEKAQRNKSSPANYESDVEVENSSTLPLLNQFLDTFLPNGQLRRNQAELWSLFEAICDSSEQLNYHGIVQWPTGTGKTIALLLLLVLSSDRCKRNGRTFRGLLVAPKNDIFDTIIHHIRKLDTFGIQVCEGHNGRLSSLTIPKDMPVLITATHAALTDSNLVANLPPLTHIHYDEVHRIGGDEFFQLLQTYLPIWQPEFLTGTSATPKTANPAQHRKLAELFGDPFTLLHKVTIEEAVKEGWIAKPRFHISVCSKSHSRDEIITAFLQTLVRKVFEKGNTNGNKYIAYLPLRSDVARAIELAKQVCPLNWKIYSATGAPGANPDCEFVTDPVDTTNRILFACERYREGSDIQGLEMTAVLMGNTISSNIALQIMGRGLRADYENKEGWCLLFRPSEEGTTEEDVLDMILLEIMETLTTVKEGELLVEDSICFVETCLGTTTIKDSTLSVQDTVQRIQALFERRLWSRNRLGFEDLRAKVREEDILTEAQYFEKREEKGWPEDPTQIQGWRSWYDLLIANPMEHRLTLSEFTAKLAASGIYVKEDYEKNIVHGLPEWSHLLMGFLTDHPAPLPSFLESSLFSDERGSR
jgi:superfamily II DNA or RNA helicase